MKKETAIKLRRAARRLGYDDVRIRSDYSGRGMYGKTCYALTVPNFAYVAAMAAAARMKKGESREDFAEEIRQLGWDGMGRDSIVVY
jgi:uncharacterized NAD-dependent epimerase/dehydratase family protein